MRVDPIEVQKGPHISSVIGNATNALPLTDVDVDYGVPVGLCFETKPGSGVFARHWTKAVAQHDCNTGKSSIAMK